jgi:molybdopterin-guanine dinucleotide biosynthesis protein A
MVEAVLLTGGQSRRMGRDKAALMVDGKSMAERLVSVLAGEGLGVTVLGPSPISGALHLPDEEAYRGPLAALARFTPAGEGVVVLSCDLPLFNEALLNLLLGRRQEREALVPVVAGYPQPLCAIYRASALAKIHGVLESGQRSMMAWLDKLAWEPLTEQDLIEAGIRPESVLGVNTPEELRERLSGPLGTA